MPVREYPNLGKKIELWDETYVPPGETMILDKIDYCLEHYMPLVKKLFEVAKIGWGIPYIIESETLHERIKTYHSYGIKVSIGGTLLEIAYHRRKEKEVLEALQNYEFDIIEVSDGSIYLKLTERERLIRLAQKMDFTVFTEVGKKNPSYKLTAKQITDLIKHDLSMGAERVIIEARESGINTVLFDSQGKLDGLLLQRIVNEINTDRLVFEAPLTINQIQLIRELGPTVKLGNINIRDLISLQTYRMGLRGDTFVDTIMRDPEGGPSVKFVYYVLKNKGPQDIKTLETITKLPTRTIQEALRNLLKQRLVASEQRGKDHSKIWFAL